MWDLRGGFCSGPEGTSISAEEQLVLRSIMSLRILGFFHFRRSTSEMVTSQQIRLLRSTFHSQGVSSPRTGGWKQWCFNCIGFSRRQRFTTQFVTRPLSARSS